MNELVELVQQWSINKGLDKADSRGQFLKVVEEVGEVAAALCRSDMDELKDGIGDVVVTLIIYAQQNNIGSEIFNISDYNGDFQKHDSWFVSKLTSRVSNLVNLSGEGLVCNIEHCNYLLKCLAEKHYMTLKECLQAAYDVIKLRDGKMVNGIFVKSEDLPKPPYDKGAWTKLSATGAVAGFEGDQDKQGDLI
jgi:NTP pyrophosphatase (non-canonical NTP hydrolase)